MLEIKSILNVNLVFRFFCRCHGHCRFSNAYLLFEWCLWTISLSLELCLMEFRFKFIIGNHNDVLLTDSPNDIKLNMLSIRKWPIWTSIQFIWLLVQCLWVIVVVSFIWIAIHIDHLNSSNWIFPELKK